eukprot:3128231-Rhodomonas_salina.1
MRAEEASHCQTRRQSARGRWIARTPQKRRRTRGTQAQRPTQGCMTPHSGDEEKRGGDLDALFNEGDLACLLLDALLLHLLRPSVQSSGKGREKSSAEGSGSERREGKGGGEGGEKDLCQLINDALHVLQSSFKHSEAAFE